MPSAKCQGSAATYTVEQGPDGNFSLGFLPEELRGLHCNLPNAPPLKKNHQGSWTIHSSGVRHVHFLIHPWICLTICSRKTNETMPEILSEILRYTAHTDTINLCSNGPIYPLYFQYVYQSSWNLKI